MTAEKCIKSILGLMKHVNIFYQLKNRGDLLKEWSCDGGFTSYRYVQILTFAGFHMNQYIVHINFRTDLKVPIGHIDTHFNLI